MRLNKTAFVVAVICGLMLALPDLSFAQRGGGGGGGRGGAPPSGGGGGRGGGGTVGRGAPGGHPGGGNPGQPSHPGGGRGYNPGGGRGYYPGGGYGGGVYWGGPYYYGSIWWRYPWDWYPCGYGPYFCGPWWYYGWYGSGWYGGSYYNDGYGTYYEVGGLKLQVKPKTAEVFVDGRYAGIVDDFDGFFDELSVPPGGHTLVLWLQGYRSVTQQVYIQRGSTLKLKYEMVALPPGEQQEPRPTPPPEEPQPLPRRMQSAPSRPAQPAEPAAPRQPASPPTPMSAPPVPPAVVAALDFGQLAIRVQPSGAQILIDGEAWQTTPGSERLIVHLPAGTHQVEVKKDGFRTFKTEVQIKLGETVPLNVSLSGQGAQ